MTTIFLPWLGCTCLGTADEYKVNLTDQLYLMMEQFFLKGHTTRIYYKDKIHSVTVQFKRVAFHYNEIENNHLKTSKNA